MSEQELYWLAGLLEGEGSFLAGPPSAPNKIRIALTMTDADVVARIASLWSVAYHEVRKDLSRKMGWKPIYHVHLRGKRAAELMRLLQPLMGYVGKARLSARSQATIHISATSYPLIKSPR